MRRFVASALVLLASNFFHVVRAADEPYKFGPDSERHEGVPQGKVTNQEWWSQVFPDTVREYFLYVPAQYDGSKPAAVMVFQDGRAYLNEKGDFRVPVVFDNLIHQGKMPVTIGIFINPGHKGAEAPKSDWKANNRSFEYDTLSDQYARFLIDELLPEVGKTYKLTDDPSSGPFAASRPAASARSRLLGSGPRRLPGSSATWAASRTSAAATTIRP